MRKLLFLIFAIAFAVVGCNDTETPSIDPAKKFELAFTLDQFDDPDSLFIGNIVVDWTDVRSMNVEGQLIYEFAVNSLTRESFVFENYRSDVQFSLIGWVENGEPQMRLMRFLPFSSYEDETVAFLQSSVYSGSTYIYLMDGTLEQIITYESGEVIAQIVKEDIPEEQATPGAPAARFCGDMHRTASTIEGMAMNSCDGNGGSCGYQNQPVDNYLDWYLVTYIDDREISRTFLYSTYNGTTMQTVYTCGGTPAPIERRTDELVPEYPEGVTAEEWLIRQRILEFQRVMDCDKMTNLHGQSQKDQWDFYDHYRGWHRDDIVNDSEDRSITGLGSQPGGPNIEFRYIEDPLNPNLIIDMRHLLVIGDYGRAVGESVEFIQYLDADSRESAFDDQDYYSNELGYSFYAEFGAAIESNPTGLADYLITFLNNQSLRNSISNPDRCK